jgi:hypothetical protein
MSCPTFARRLVVALALAAGTSSALASAGAASFHDVTLTFQDFAFDSPLPIASSTANSVTLVDGLRNLNILGHFTGPNGSVSMSGKFKVNVYLDACTSSGGDIVNFLAGYSVGAAVSEIFIPTAVSCADDHSVTYFEDRAFATGVAHGDTGQPAQFFIGSSFHGVPIPEPSTNALLIGGLVGLAFYSRKRLRQDW